ADDSRARGVRSGDMVTGQVRPPKDSEKYHGLVRVEAVNGLDPEVAKRRPHFDTLTPIFPRELINLETVPNNTTQRLINLVSPIGRGQRGLIVSPPKAGKTTVLKHIANGITTNYQEIHLMVVLIGQRPEEGTHVKRPVRAEVVSPTFDGPGEDQPAVAEMAPNRANGPGRGGRDVWCL